jgi:hypothetical protein
MCFTGTKCEIGFLKVFVPGDQLLENHQPEITVVAVYSGNRAEILFQRKWPRESPSFNSATLSVTNPKAGYERPRFFLKASPDAKDFAKGVDLEHDLNNEEKHDIVRDAFLPRIQIEQGDFHSLLETPQEYEAVPDGHAGPVKQLGKMAYMTAANLHCDPSRGAVVLNIDNGMESHSWSVSGRKIFVIVHNNCQKDGKKCIEDKPDETTDFHLFYLAMRNPKKYKINCKTPPPTNPDFRSLDPNVLLALCAAGLVPSDYCKRPEFETTNPTPCGIGGFGESDSLGGS